MIVLGITGSIGMGKSTIASLLARMGIPVHDSDAHVHQLLSQKGPAYSALKQQFPIFVYPQLYDYKFLKEGTFRPFNRKRLGKLAFENPKEREKLEKTLHPFVRQSQDDFIRLHRNMGADIVAFDIPLLFETGAEHRVDYTLVACAPAFIQQTRVLSRPNMTKKKFESIKARQMDDSEKCTRADFVIPTGLGRAHTMKKLKQIVHDIRSKDKEAQEIKSYA